MTIKAKVSSALPTVFTLSSLPSFCPALKTCGRTVSCGMLGMELSISPVDGRGNQDRVKTKDSKNYMQDNRENNNGLLQK